MAGFLNVILRFGPLVAATALGLGVVLEPLIPGYTGIVNAVISGLGLAGISPDKEVLATLGDFTNAAFVLVGVARKLISLYVGKAKPPVVPVA